MPPVQSIAPVQSLKPKPHGSWNASPSGPVTMRPRSRKTTPGSQVTVTSPRPVSAMGPLS